MWLGDIKMQRLHTARSGTGIRKMLMPSLSLLDRQRSISTFGFFGCHLPMANAITGMMTGFSVVYPAAVQIAHLVPH